MLAHIGMMQNDPKWLGNEMIYHWVYHINSWIGVHPNDFIASASPCPIWHWRHLGYSWFPKLGGIIRIGYVCSSHDCQTNSKPKC